MLQLPGMLHTLLINSATIWNRQIWSYVAVAFNKVDFDRLKRVGPDRLCAEWVLKNGGAVSFLQTSGFFKDYNSLPDEKKLLHIQQIDATDSSIMKIGLEHLKSCKHIERIIIHRCKHLENDGLMGLIHVKQSLKYLQISSCYNIDDEGLDVLKELTSLKNLILFDLISVNDLDAVISALNAELSGCSISGQ